jgi:hypothetical protein
MRLRHPPMQMTVWTVVLAMSLAMPTLTPWMRVTIPAYWSAAPAAAIAPANVPPIALTAPMPAEPAAGSESLSQGVAVESPHAFEWRVWATRAYLLVGGAMLLRLLMGLAIMGYVVRAARPVRDGWAAGADVRVSRVVIVPLTFASTILLPAASSEWSARMFRTVLLHEGADVAHGDFYVLLLASIHRAVFWFNPFAWWLFDRLAELAEAVSDDAAIEGLGDRGCYADVLVEMAANPQRLPAGLVSVAPRASPLPSGDAALARLIEGVRRGAPEYDRMTPEVAAETRLHLSGQQAMLARLGALRQTIFRGVSEASNDIYTIRFANGSAVWQIGLVDGGRIGPVALGP